MQKRAQAGSAFQPIDVKIDLAIARPLASWLKVAIDGRLTTQSGVIDTMDSAGAPVSQLLFTNALVTEVGLPEVGGGLSVVDGAIDIQLDPETTTYQRATAPAGTASANNPQRTLPTAFLFSVEGVTWGAGIHLKPLIWKASADLGTSGGSRTYAKPFTQPTVVATFAASAGSPWKSWITSGAAAKSGTLQYVTASGQPLATVNLIGLVPTRVAPSAMNAGASQTIQTDEVTMSVQRAEIVLPP
ncbi:MAG TPA: hypothetical protein VF765_34555 [Polyangiaceae bacterium]